ncbi:lytic transglycosylase domain-containing protein [Leucobacter sp. gxy201]
MNSHPRSSWSKIRAAFAVTGVIVLFGTAVVAPFAMPGGETDAEALAFETRINQEFVPNEFPEDDIIYPEIETVELPDPAEVERQKREAEAAAAAEKAAKEASSSQATAPARYTGGGAPAEWMAAAGIAESDWGYVDYIASRESGWNPNATNASSGACGVIQANPCSKVPGNGYDPVDNLRWANGYAVGRYGSWAQAYDFWTTNHWW